MYHRPNTVPRASLTSLPKEILTTISLLLPDRPSVQSLSLTCRSIHPCCEQALWRDIELSVHPHFALLPSVAPNEESASAGSAWAISQEQNAEAARQAELRGMIKAVMNAANRRRWNMVERVKLEVRLGAINGMVQLLDNTTNVKSLEINAPPVWHLAEDVEEEGHIQSYRLDAPDHETLDVRCITAGLSFPSLSHIRLNQGVVHFVDFIPLLCRASPSLTSLDVDLTGVRTAADSGILGFPTFDGPTQLQELRLALCTIVDLTSPIAALLEHSPQLVRLCLVDSGSSFDPEHETGALVGLLHLRDLAWNIRPATLWSHLETNNISGRAILPGLRRLVLKGSVWHDIYEDIWAFPNLEEIFIDISPAAPLCQTGPTSFPEPIRSQAMIASLVNHMEDCPRLRLIHTLRDHVNNGGFEVFTQIDEISRRGTGTGIARSFRSDGHDGELLHARFLLDHYEESDTAGAGQAGSTSTALPYFAGIIQRNKTYKFGPYATWQDFTDYEGHTVPLEIIARMREAEGVSVGEWEGRGIEVGEAGWKVLTDWVAEQ